MLSCTSFRFRILNGIPTHVKATVSACEPYALNHQLAFRCLGGRRCIMAAVDAMRNWAGCACLRDGQGYVMKPQAIGHTPTVSGH